ncbi:MAG: UDP-N-acetylmuramoyl-L-alanyl-D-glutamate--2,6-diaminopimelate ligase [Gammaproteobacteria bacterium]|nr:UDP-N-acetylmuramoyl-L-alanyl-D-glutamate--2,6-diaminopimelate ligase [Gammaproteobacteria bacterium]
MMGALSTHQLSLGELIGDEVPPEYRGISIGGLSLDSSTIRPGDAFLACAGSHRHGLDFAGAAAEAGASVVLYESRGSDAEVSLQRIPCVHVRRLRERAGTIASSFFGAPSERMAVAGITGTNGKTSTSRLIAAAGQHAGLRCGMSGTLGYGLPDELQPTTLTTPDPIVVHERLAALVDVGVRYVAMEVSSHALDQHRVEGVSFDTAVFTNLSRDHLDYHGDMQAYFEAKRLLFALPDLRKAVVNVDDSAGAELARDIADTVSVIAVGHGDAVLGFDAVRIAELETSTTGLWVALETPLGEAVIESSLLGDFNATNISLALAVLLNWEVDLDTASSTLSSVPAAPGRMEAFGGGDLPLIVVDYAHTPHALENALQALRKHCPGDLWVLFGCGGERDRGKRPLMGEIAARLADRVVITDDNPRREDPTTIIEEISRGVDAGDRVRIQPGRREAIEWVVSQAQEGDVVLLAGKGHEDYQLIGGERLSLSDRDEARGLVGERK